VGLVLFIYSFSKDISCTAGAGTLAEYHEKASEMRQSSELICCMCWTFYTRQVLEQSLLQLYISLKNYGVHLVIAECN